MTIIISSFPTQSYGLCCCKYSWYICLLSIYEISPYDKSILNPQRQGFPKCCSPNPSLMLFYLLNKQTPCHPNPTPFYLDHPSFLVDSVHDVLLILDSFCAIMISSVAVWARVYFAVAWIFVVQRIFPDAVLSCRGLVVMVCPVSLECEYWMGWRPL